MVEQVIALANAAIRLFTAQTSLGFARQTFGGALGDLPYCEQGARRSGRETKLVSAKPGKLTAREIITHLINQLHQPLGIFRAPKPHQCFSQNPAASI